MKAQFKHAIMSGGSARIYAFAVIFIMNLTFVCLGAMGLLPFAAIVTAVSLSGVAIAVMMVMNVIGDIAIIRRMFAAPGAYLYALTPVPRWKTLLARVVTITVMDTVTMTVAIVSVTWLSLILAGNFIGDFLWDAVSSGLSNISLIIGLVMIVLAGYLLFMMIIVFCITAKKSIFYKKRGGGVLTALTALGIIYATSIAPLLLIPFGAVSVRWGMHITVHLGRLGLIMYALLTLIQAAALFAATSWLMERKLNI